LTDEEEPNMVALTAIVLILVFILVDLGIQYYRRPATARALSTVASTAEDLLSEFLVPLGYFFHPGHTWIRIQDRGEILVGADDFVQKSLGKIDRVGLPKVGNQIQLNSPAFNLFQGDKQATFLAPISGTVTDVNYRIQNEPQIIKEQPYGSGWILKVKPSSAGTEIKSLLIADSATQWLKKEITNLRDFLMDIANRKSELGTTLADGGVPVSGVMEDFGEPEWNDFQQRFLSNKA
jgi:glycine cleavage system H lipoate-binding protein